MHKLIYILLALLPLIAQANESGLSGSLTEYQTINPNLEILRFEFQILDARNTPIYGEIHVAASDGELIQTIPVESWLPNPNFDFIDLNDDGYIDLLFYDKDAGMCCGASTGAEVFLYIPKLKRYAKSETLTGRGNISKLKTKSCVNVNYKSSMSGYTDEEWCFALKTGHWKMIKSSSNEPR